MNRRRATMRATAAAVAIGTCLAGVRAARANPMDLAPERLATCDTKSAIPCGEATVDAAGTHSNYFRADNAAWAKLVSQYAMAIAPMAMHPARTTGYGGFEFSLFGSITTVSKDEDFMKRGTEGAITTNNKFPNSNGTPDSVLQLYGVSGRKGLPYGFEMQGSIGYIANTELVAMGGGVRFAPFEGFRKGALGAIPDISVGAYVNTLTGTNKVKMTVPALDVQISKPFTIANQLVVQPYLGWQIVWIDVDSGVVDATPKVDGLAACNARPPSPVEQKAGDNGEFHCQQNTGGTLSNAPPGSPAANSKLDLNNNLVFQNVRFTRQRLMLGFAFRYEVVHVVLHAMMDLSDPSAGAGSNKPERIDGLARQFTFGVMTGVSW